MPAFWSCAERHEQTVIDFEPRDAPAMALRWLNARNE